MPLLPSDTYTYRGAGAGASGRKCIDAAEVARRLHARMTELRKTQEEFAGLVGISQGMLSLVLTNKRPPGTRVLRYLGLRRVNHFESAKGR